MLHTPGTLLPEKISEKMSAGLSEEIIDEEGVHKVNSIFMMADSGARGSNQQMKQLAGMRGLMAKPSGEIIETPIHANFREGLNVLEYFISTHGARKGLADTALKTANSGYLTRRLVDVSQDCVVMEDDCGTLDGIEMTSLIESGEIIEPLGDRILGRVLLDDVIDPDAGNKILISAGTLMNELERDIIQNSRIETVRIRSALTCMTVPGVCRACYGRDLCHGGLINLGEAVGVIAAQSIGEPGTQLTMRTFHIGGTASRLAEQNKWEASFSGVLRFNNLKEVKNREGNFVILGRRGEAVIVEGDKTIPAEKLTDLENERERERRPLPMGATLLKKEGEFVEQGDLIAEWDPFSIPIITDATGIVHFQDISEGETFKEQVDEVAVQYDDKNTAKVPVGTADITTLCPIGSIPVQNSNITSPSHPAGICPNSTSISRLPSRDLSQQQHRFWTGRYFRDHAEAVRHQINTQNIFLEFILCTHNAPV